MSGSGYCNYDELTVHTAFDYPWMETFAEEEEKIEKRKELLRELLRKDPARYGFLVVDFMNGVLVPVRCKFKDLLLSEKDVWSRETVQVVYELVAQACKLVIYEVPEISEIYRIAEKFLKGTENEMEDVIADLHGKVKSWVEHGVVAIPWSG
ncbi:hypothetical protein ACHQM5_024959 [Ranunculus cassubicifolius]